MALLVWNLVNGKLGLCALFEVVLQNCIGKVFLEFWISHILWYVHLVSYWQHAVQMLNLHQLVLCRAFFLWNIQELTLQLRLQLILKSKEPLLCSFLDFRGILVDLEYDWSSLFSSSSTASFSLELYCKYSLSISGSPALSMSWKNIYN